MDGLFHPMVSPMMLIDQNTKEVIQSMVLKNQSILLLPLLVFQNYTLSQMILMKIGKIVFWLHL